MSSPEGSSVQSPTARARELVRGAFDIHVHSAPDVVKRRIDDLELAKRMNEVGLAGYVIKSHYVPTSARARLVNAAVGGARLIGSVTLNTVCGGMSPMAIEMAAREGARVVWMPTVDSENEHRNMGGNSDPSKLPAWALVQKDLREMGVNVEPVRVVDGAGVVLPEARQVLRRIAHHDMVLATGHLNRDEIFAVTGAAFEEGVRNVIITHPDFPTQNLSVEDQMALAEQGAYLERCFAVINKGKISWEKTCEYIRATGVGSNVIATDLGQVGSPPVEDGLALAADNLLAGGFSEEEVKTMIVTNSVKLALGAEA